MFDSSNIITIDSDKNTLWDILRELKEESGNRIPACAIISAEGLPIESNMMSSDEINEPKLAAMGAAMVSLGVTAGREFAQGIFEEIYVESSEGFMLVRQAGMSACVVAVCNKDAKLGLVKHLLKGAAEKVSKIMS